MSTTKIFGIATDGDIRDTIVCTPVARQLAMSHPGARIVWFTTARNAPVLRENPWVDEVSLLEGGSREQLDAEVAAIEEQNEWTAFYRPSPDRHRARLPGVREWDLVQRGTDIDWIIPMRFVVELSEPEIMLARRYWSRLPSDGPKILIETEEGRSLSPEWSSDWLFDLVDAFGSLNPTFVFTAENPPVAFYEFRDVWPKSVWCREPLRWNAEFYDLCDAFIGVGGPVSALGFSTWCRRNVPHVEIAANERAGSAALRQPEDVWSCFTRARFREAIEAIAARLGGTFVANFEPRHPRQPGTPDCPGCGNPTARDSRAGFVNCGHCNVLLDDGLSTPSQSAAEPSFAARAQRVAARVEHLRCALETWGGPIGRGMVVEVGCRGGELLRAARARGFAVAGVTSDPATLAAPDAHELGIRDGTLATAGIEPGSVAVLMLSHELPRQAHPDELLEVAQHLLAPGGVVYLTTPNLASIGHALDGVAWSWMAGGEYRTYVTVEYLTRTAAELGLFVEVVETTVGEFDPDELCRIVRRLKPDVSSAAIAELVARANTAGRGEELRCVLRKRGVSKARARTATRWATD